jgi:hypothetical protein
MIKTLHDQSLENVSQPKWHHQSNAPHPIIEVQQTLLSILKSKSTKKKVFIALISNQKAIKHIMNQTSIVLIIMH